MRYAFICWFIGALVGTSAWSYGPWHFDRDARWTQIKLMEVASFFCIAGIALAVFNLF